MLVTHIELTGETPVVAQAVRAMPGDPPGPDRVLLYVGDNLCLTMPVSVADAVGDALAAVDDVVSW